MRNSNGVTLIVLIIMIVLLLILSSVSIQTLFDTSAINNTKDLSKEAEINNLKEKLKMECLAEKNKTGSRNIGYEQLEEIIKRNISSDEDLVRDENNNIVIVKTTHGYEVNIEELKTFFSESGIDIQITKPQVE